MSARRLLDIAKAAAYLGFVDEQGNANTKALYRLIESGSIAHIRIRDRVHTRVTAGGRRQQYRKPGRVYLLESDCDAWIEAHRVEASGGSPATRRAPSLTLPEAHERRFS